MREAGGYTGSNDDPGGTPLGAEAQEEKISSECGDSCGEKKVELFSDACLLHPFFPLRILEEEMASSPLVAESTAFEFTAATTCPDGCVKKECRYGHEGLDTPLKLLLRQWHPNDSHICCDGPLWNDCEQIGGYFEERNNCYYIPLDCCCPEEGAVCGYECVDYTYQCVQIYTWTFDCTGCCNWAPVCEDYPPPGCSCPLPPGAPPCIQYVNEVYFFPWPGHSCLNDVLCGL